MSSLAIDIPYTFSVHATRWFLQTCTDTGAATQQLMHGIVHRNADEIRASYYRGAELNTTRFHLYRYTPLQYAVQIESVVALRELIALGALVNERSANRDKVTALYLACRGRFTHQTQIIRTLLHAGANPNQAVKGGTTPLMEACFQMNVAAVGLLLRFGADPNRIDSFKNTALDICQLQPLHKNHAIIHRMLLERGAQSSGEHSEPASATPENLHPKVNGAHLFRNGFLLPDSALQAVRNDPELRPTKLKKYTPEIPSLLRSVVIGRRSRYILYDSNQFFTTCEGCLDGCPSTNPLGKGGQAKVKIAQDCASGEFHAVRIARSLAPYELEILQVMGDLQDYVYHGGKHYIIQTLHHGQTLAAFQLASGPEAEAQLKQIAINLLCQLHRLHSHGYLHRDLAGQNVMIDPDTLAVRLIDFGFAIRSRDAWCTWGVVRHWGMRIAPELELGRRYSEQSDLYAAAGLIVDLMSYSRAEFPELVPILRTLLGSHPNNRGNASDALHQLQAATPSSSD